MYLSDARTSGDGNYRRFSSTKCLRNSGVKSSGKFLPSFCSFVVRDKAQFQTPATTQTQTLCTSMADRFYSLRESRV